MQEQLVPLAQRFNDFGGHGGPMMPAPVAPVPVAQAPAAPAPEMPRADPEAPTEVQGPQPGA